jgi:hypothetical protein
MFANIDLFVQNTSYIWFVRDLLHAKHEVIIENLFITENRMNILLLF